MSEDGITVGNVVRFVVFTALYEAILVGAYLFAFRAQALSTVGAGSTAPVLLALLGTGEVVLVAVLGGVVSAGAAAGAFFDYPKPNLVDVVRPGGPSGILRPIALVNVAFRTLFWATFGVWAGGKVYLMTVHPGAIPTQGADLGGYLDAVLAHPDAGAGMLVGAAVGGILGAFGRPTRSSGRTATAGDD